MLPEKKAEEKDELINRTKHNVLEKYGRSTKAKRTGATTGAQQMGEEKAFVLDEKVDEDKKPGRCKRFFAGVVHFFAVKMRILLPLFQILGKLGATFKIPFPKVYVDALDWISAIDLGIPDLLPLSCMGFAINYYTSFLMRTAGPLALVAGRCHHGLGGIFRRRLQQQLARLGLQRGDLLAAGRGPARRHHHPRIPLQQVDGRENVVDFGDAA
mgnify:CR=1 FL=1